MKLIYVVFNYTLFPGRIWLNFLHQTVDLDGNSLIVRLTPVLFMYHVNNVLTDARTLIGTAAVGYNQDLFLHIHIISGNEMS